MIDRIITLSDNALRTISGTHSETLRPAPGKPPAPDTSEQQLPEASHSENETAPPGFNEEERKRVAGLMRINHTGEICAQALYQGQAMTARLPRVRKAMKQAAREEEDHLAWCETRLRELDSRTSYLNPLWYAYSFGIGAIAGIIGDKWSLGFVEETEHQVCAHLSSHLSQLPEHDHRTRAILSEMYKDEARHATTAANAGAAPLPRPVKRLMGFMSKIMTKTTYFI